MIKEQEFRKQTEEAKFEAFSLMCKKVAELEEAKANLEYLLEGRDNEIDELKKENKNLAQNLEDTEILNNTYEKRFKNLEKENAELKEQNETKDIQIKELQEQKCYWKESSFDWRHKFFEKDEVKRLVKKDKQLTKAKEIIKKLVDGIRVISDPKVELTDVDSFITEAEQFLNSEVEK